MLTKGHWLIIRFKIKRFGLWIPVPLFVLKELIWQLIELADIGKTFGNKKTREWIKVMPIVLVALDGIGESSQYDLVDIDVDDGEGSVVRIAVKVR